MGKKKKFPLYLLAFKNKEEHTVLPLPPVGEHCFSSSYTGNRENHDVIRVLQLRLAHMPMQMDRPSRVRQAFRQLTKKKEKRKEPLNFK